MPCTPGVTAASLGAWDPSVAVATPGEALGGLWATRTGWHRMAPMGPTYRACLGQQCACERSSWTFSHLCMMIVDADSHACRRGHPVLCCPLHGRSGRCVPDAVGLNRGLVGWSSATVMARIKALTGLFECCGEHCAARQGLECPCAALGSPQGPHASCVVSVRWFIGARLAGTGLLCAPTVCGGSAPNGYTNNLGVVQATVMLSMGQRCACSTQGCHKQCKVLLEQPASHPNCWCNRWGRSHRTQ